MLGSCGARLMDWHHITQLATVHQLVRLDSAPVIVAKPIPNRANPPPFARPDVIYCFMPNPGDSPVTGLDLASTS
jgi:hypothetical protein